MQVTADEVIVYTPPGVANKDIAIKVPRIIATVKKLDKETRKATGHIWAMEATLVDMKVYYVFVELVSGTKNEQHPLAFVAVLLYA